MKKENFITSRKDVVVDLLQCASNEKTYIAIEGYKCKDNKRYSLYCVVTVNIVSSSSGGYTEAKITRTSFKRSTDAKGSFARLERKFNIYNESSHFSKGCDFVLNSCTVDHFISSWNTEATNKMINSLKFVSKESNLDDKNNGYDTIITIKILKHEYKLYVRKYANYIKLEDVVCINDNHYEYMIDVIYNNLLGGYNCNICEETMQAFNAKTNMPPANLYTPFSDFCSDNNIKDHDERRLIKVIFDLIKDHI